MHIPVCCLAVWCIVYHRVNQKVFLVYSLVKYINIKGLYVIVNIATGCVREFKPTGYETQRLFHAGFLRCEYRCHLSLRANLRLPTARKHYTRHRSHQRNKHQQRRKTTTWKRSHPSRSSRRLIVWRRRRPSMLSPSCPWSEETMACLNRSLRPRRKQTCSDRKTSKLSMHTPDRWQLLAFMEI